MGCWGGAALPALGEDKKLKVASIFATPIEEPWDHQIHVACKRRKRSRHRI